MGVKLNSAAPEVCQLPFRRVTIHLLLIAGLLCLQGAVTAEPLTGSTGRSGMVAIDPGHGGRDVGAKGPGGSLEKQVCLAFARTLTALLEPAFRVALTRSDDYDVPLEGRTAIANHNKAALLISIHTAASFLHTTSGIHIYSYKPNSDEPKEVGADRNALEQGVSWRRVQMRHAAASRMLAEKIRQAFAALPGAPPVQTHLAPLVVLEGADMPAVVVEIGYLSNPDDESNLNTIERQELYAVTIAKGIDAFLASLADKTQTAPATR